ncbi:unnamed protein product [Arabis nemorensis]|uniref:Uncharacterized protein n=1 Tax=Arabis nemorensis TaxID=586526 RepID=A0A565AS26_9BRAS|nr:unnamed protein product [Arabis nemorensis]
MEPSEVPRNRYWGLHPPPAPFEDVVDNGLMGIQRAIFLRKAGMDTPVDEEYLEASREKDLSHPVREGIDTLLMLLYRALKRVDDMGNLASSDKNCVMNYNALKNRELVVTRLLKGRLYNLRGRCRRSWRLF